MQKLQELLDEFQIEKNIPDDISYEEWYEKYNMEFFQKIEKFNSNILDIDYNAISEKYGYTYYTSRTKHANTDLDP